MRTKYNLSNLPWNLSGWTPDYWRLHQTMELGNLPEAEVTAIPAKVPGSVQLSLREAGLLPDWNVGLNYRACEWVENRHWIYETIIPDEWLAKDLSFRLICRGLDYSGWVILNGQTVSSFVGSHVPHIFDVTPYLREQANVLRIVFDLPPRWLGQFGYTSLMKEWKPRFNYTWDWTPRLVQIGISKPIFLEVTDGNEICELRCFTDAHHEKSRGILRIIGRANAPEGAHIRARLYRGDCHVRQETLPIGHFNNSGFLWDDLPIELWWPNLMGDQPLYTLEITLLDQASNRLDTLTRRLGFRNVTWMPCDDSPPEADPWICVVNGRPVFLQGVNWVPILPNFADVTEQQYRDRLMLYRDLGLNILRVWGGASLEFETFYNLCDELGLMVWQEFPLSSSGVDNCPPADEQSISEMASIAESCVVRRQHHPSLIIWCGGNELQVEENGISRPLDSSHPMLARLQKLVEVLDPTRRFLATSSSGPRFSADSKEFGRGLHWDVHGPWKPDGSLEQWEEYFNHDDALFRSETGAPSASPAHIIIGSAGDSDVMPPNASNPLWRRTSPWWIEWERFLEEIGREPQDLEEYVIWSQERQKRALCIAVRACKARFPRCGGIIIWMGHDCFPCVTNTAIVDFEGNPKPAALALREIWRNPVKPHGSEE